jgi:3-oxoacyl-[acyl-carrier protein] reductase
LAVITGASKGIGSAVSIVLAERGWDLILVSRGNKDLEDTAVQCRLHGISAQICRVDLSVPSGIVKPLNDLLDKEARVHALINNAGVGLFSPLHELDINDWLSTIHTNLTSVFAITKTVLPHMFRAGRGHIVNISSDADSVGFCDATAYCASKAGVAGFSRALAEELKTKNIKVTVVSPGRVDTNFNGKHPGDRPDALDAYDVAYAIACALEAPKRSCWQSLRIENI